jgi:hypothetical protein
MGNQFYINGGTTTLNYSCYSNSPGDIDTLGGALLNVANNNITSNPLFVNAANSDFRIYGNSPCVNSGNNSYNSELNDIRGQARIQDTTIDMGAYEWTAGVDPAAPPFIWTGSVSTDWNTPGNWSTNVVPKAGDDVIIPVVTTHYPVVNESPATPAVCNNLTIASGAIVTIATGKALTINGTFTINK